MIANCPLVNLQNRDQYLQTREATSRSKRRKAWQTESLARVVWVVRASTYVALVHVAN